MLSIAINQPTVRLSAPPRSWFWIGLLGAILLLRLVAMCKMVLVPEEAYYWMYAQHPSMSYFDHPPMIAWVIRSGTALFGNTEFGVRVVGNLLMCATSGLLYLYGRMWYGRRAALIAAAALLVLPAYFGIGFIATMDAPLVFFWTACLLGISIALKRENAAGWYLAGAAMGAALLSKYTGIFLGLGALLTVLGSRQYRRHLLTAHPYLAALLALAIFSPVIVWNAQHDWASFRFQFFDRFPHHDLAIGHAMNFVGLQFAVATPVVLIAALWLGVRLTRSPRQLLKPRWWIALCFCAPLLGVMSYKSLRYAIHLNWTLPAYLSLLPPVAHLLLISARRERIRGLTDRALPIIRWTAGACVAVNAGLVLFLLLAQPKLGAQLGTFSAVGPWRELASVVEEYEDRLEARTGREPLIVADGKYRLASILAFYRTPLEESMPAARFTSSQWLTEGEGLGFEFWLRRGDWLGKDFLFVDHDADLLQDIQGRCDRFEMIDDPRLTSLGYQVALCYGYRGPRAEGSPQ